MSPTVTVGLDGSPESRAAADWAAWEALRRQAALHLVQVVESGGSSPYSPVMDEESERDHGETILRETELTLVQQHPSLRTTTELLSGRPAKALTEVSGRTDLLVLGSRGLGSVLGFIVGSVALPAVAHSQCPVVLVRAGEGTGDESASAGLPNDVVLGVESLERPADELIAFAFETAARWSAVLRALHSWDLPPAFGVRPLAAPAGLANELTEEKSEALGAMLRPWREKFPGVEVEHQAVLGRPAHHLIQAASDAGLVIVGRRIRRSALGTHVGSVAHAVMHHADVPVAVVRHN